jgi:hypothetical protein
MYPQASRTPCRDARPGEQLLLVPCWHVSFCVSPKNCKKLQAVLIGSSCSSVTHLCLLQAQGTLAEMQGR